MSKSEAEHMFRDMFGNNFNGMFRDYAAQQQPGRPNPYAQDPNVKVTQDEYMRDQYGNTYRVTTYTTDAETGDQAHQQQHGRRRFFRGMDPAQSTPGSPFGGGGGNPFARAFGGGGAGGPTAGPSPFGDFFGRRFDRQQTFTQGGPSGGGFSQQYQQQQASARNYWNGGDNTSSSSSSYPGADAGASNGHYWNQTRQPPGGNPFGQFRWSPYSGMGPPIFRPARLMVLVLLIGCFCSLVFTIFISHPGLSLLCLGMYLLFRRPGRYF